MGGNQGMDESESDGDDDETSVAEAVAARLREVVFSYDPYDELPAAEDLDGEATASRSTDPDERGGPVLRGVELTIPEGGFTVVMGASGGGKSTLLRTFNAVIPDFIRGSFDGEIEVLGRDAAASRVSEMAEVVGMVFQDYETQLFRTSVPAEVAFGPENLAVPPAEIDERIDRTLRLVGLEDLDRASEPAGLSGGQKQRLVLASVLAMYPDLLVLDEPTSDLDPRGTHELVDVMRAVAADGEATNDGTPGKRASGAPEWAPDSAVMVTHKVEEALLADRAVLLRDGRVFCEGPVRAVFTDVDSLEDSRVAVPPLVAAFDRLGWPADDLPLLPAEAAHRVHESALEWTPPARRNEAFRDSGNETGTTESTGATGELGEPDGPGAPAGTGRELGETVFELEGVGFEYQTDRGPIRAVDGVDLTIREGETVGIVGGNGSGKTTLAKHLNGLHEPDAGSVAWHGRPVSGLSMAEIGRGVGYVFQNPDHQLFAETVREEVAFGPENFGLSGGDLDRRVREAIETVEIDGLVARDPFTLSKGQRQRVALAGVLATDPETIVFDEPTTGLDAAQQEQFLDLIARLNRDERLTVVMVTHDMETIARYAPRTVVLENGRKAYDGPTRDLFADPGRLDAYGLRAPHVVETANELTDDSEDEGLPALSVEELVTGLGGPGAYGGDREERSVEPASKGEDA